MNKFLNEKFNLHEPSWKPAYPLFSKVINQFNLRIGVEIGVAFGGHSEAILNQTNIDKLYSVDKYQHDPSYDDPLNFDQDQFDELYEFVKNRLSVFGSRCELVRCDSEKSTQVVPDGIDFVYIDADHSFSGVFKDLCLWFRKIRDGGIIAGHDYGHVNHPGVKKAIDQFFGRFGWIIHEEGEGVWWVEKKNLSISFIIPAYNCADTIGETIDSVINSNYENGDEIIVVNDCSTDNTLDVINAYQSRFPYIKIFNHKVNKGTAAAGRNTGIEQSSTPLIFCLDSDNILAPGSVSALKAHLINQGADAAAFGELHYFKKTVNEVSHKWVFRDEINFADIFSGNIWPGSSGNYLFTKESWVKAGRYYEPSLENQVLDSWAFGVRLIGTGSKMVTLSNTWYLHRYGHQSHYMRNYKRGNVSISALIAIAPFLNLIEDKDIDYVFSKKGRYCWYENLANKPIHVKEGTIRHSGSIVDGTLHVEQTQTGLKGNSIIVLFKKIWSRVGKIFRKLRAKAGKWRT